MLLASARGRREAGRLSAGWYGTLGGMQPWRMLRGPPVAPAEETAPPHRPGATAASACTCTRHSCRTLSIIIPVRHRGRSASTITPSRPPPQLQPPSSSKQTRRSAAVGGRRTCIACGRRQARGHRSRSRAARARPRRAARHRHRRRRSVGRSLSHFAAVLFARQRSGLIWAATTSVTWRACRRALGAACSAGRRHS